MDRPPPHGVVIDMDPKLTKKQAEDLDTAYVCQTANGVGSYTLHGAQMRALEKKGLATSFLGSSINGGSSARHYRLTATGLALGRAVYEARHGRKREPEDKMGYMQGRGAS